MCLLCRHSDRRRAVGRSRSLANDPWPKSWMAHSKRRTQHPLPRISNPRRATNTFMRFDRRAPDGKNGRIEGRSVADVRRTQRRGNERVQRWMRGQVGEGRGGFPISGRDVGKGLKSWWMFGNGCSTIQRRKDTVSERIGSAHGGCRAAV